MKLMKVLAEAIIAGALGFTAFGLGAGVANATPPSPVALGTPWAQDGHGHGHGGDCGDDGCWGGGNWGGGGGNWGGGGGNWGGGPGWGTGPIGCVSGPVGWGNGFLCI
jgi:hypothetical protein